MSSRNRAVTEEVALQECELEILGQIQNDIWQPLLMGLPTWTPCLEEPGCQYAVEVELDPLAIGIVIHPWLFAKNVPNDLVQLLDKGLVLVSQVQTDLMFAETSLSDVPTDEPHEVGRYAEESIKDLVLMGSGHDLDVITDAQ